MLVIVLKYMADYLGIKNINGKITVISGTQIDYLNLKNNAMQKELMILDEVMKQLAANGKLVVGYIVYGPGIEGPPEIGFIPRFEMSLDLGEERSEEFIESLILELAKNLANNKEPDRVEYYSSKFDIINKFKTDN